MENYCTGYLDIKCKSCENFLNHRHLSLMTEEGRYDKMSTMKRINIENCVVTNMSKYKQTEVEHAIST